LINSCIEKRKLKEEKGGKIESLKKRQRWQEQVHSTKVLHDISTGF